MDQISKCIKILRKEAESQNRSAGDGHDLQVITEDMLHWALESMLNNIADRLEEE